MDKQYSNETNIVYTIRIAKSIDIEGYISHLRSYRLSKDNDDDFGEDMLLGLKNYLRMLTCARDNARISTITFNIKNSSYFLNASIMNDVSSLVRGRCVNSEDRLERMHYAALSSAILLDYISEWTDWIDGIHCHIISHAEVLNSLRQSDVDLIKLSMCVINMFMSAYDQGATDRSSFLLALASILNSASSADSPIAPLIGLAGITISEDDKDIEYLYIINSMLGSI